MFGTKTPAMKIAPLTIGKKESLSLPFLKFELFL